MTIETVRQLLGIALLLAAAFEDVKKKSVHVAVPAVGGAAGIGLSIAGSLVNSGSLANAGGLANAGSLWKILLQIFLSALPGAFLLLCCLLFRGQIGSGDGAVLLGLGLICGWQTALGAFVHGLVYTGLFALVLLAKRMPKDTALPFLPFLLAGYVTTLAV